MIQHTTDFDPTHYPTSPPKPLKPHPHIFTYIIKCNYNLRAKIMPAAVQSLAVHLAAAQPAIICALADNCRYINLIISIGLWMCELKDAATFNSYAISYTHSNLYLIVLNVLPYIVCAVV